MSCELADREGHERRDTGSADARDEYGRGVLARPKRNSAARARTDGEQVAGGACLRLRSQIEVGTKLRVEGRWDKFSGVARSHRKDGRDYVVGIQRDSAESAAATRHWPKRRTGERNFQQECAFAGHGADRRRDLTKTGGTVPSGGVRNQELSIEGSEAFSPTGANVKI